MQSYQYNIYDLNWKYLGCFWTAAPYFPYKVEGDYIQTTWRGPLLCKDGTEMDEIKPIDCFLKLVEVKNEAN